MSPASGLLQLVFVGLDGGLVLQDEIELVDAARQAIGGKRFQWEFEPTVSLDIEGAIGDVDTHGLVRVVEQVVRDGLVDLQRLADIDDYPAFLKAVRAGNVQTPLSDDAGRRLERLAAVWPESLT